jgi:hypothetical protein
VSADPRLTPKAKRMWAWLLFVVVVVLIEFYLLMIAAMGDCPGPCPDGDEQRRFLLFPGSLFLAVPIVVVVTAWVMRKNRND